MDKGEHLIKNKITNEELNELPLQHYTGEIVVVEDANGVTQVMKEINGETILGFDTETRPSFKKGKTNFISLIQLTTEKSTFLIRTNKTGVTQELVDLLRDENVKKVGVGIRDDIRGLQKIEAFEPGGFVELQTMAVDKGLKDFSLKKLAGILLEFRVSKRQRLSNWEADELSQGQMIYAATDSWVALEIFKKLNILDKGQIIDVEPEEDQA
ncbi:3'-5' exonuclease [Labilibacter marinus]|uniref:3'-5' exonuclease n=1 Tax=Labilibacter marinus TaxID=1477105 RepID=UPI001E42221A|nr:3'-5' exonuclease [Labilibacter marinus]